MLPTQINNALKDWASGTFVPTPFNTDSCMIPYESHIKFLESLWSSRQPQFYRLMTDLYNEMMFGTSSLHLSCSYPLFQIFRAGRGDDFAKLDNNDTFKILDVDAMAI